ncbi:MAG: hypothetical protein GWN71_41110, partial [Gammaproteobacteria bacterium]|nr:hypothetical protein [Gemmatimonadota bacterium]NIU79716.1 hypothetical protein [Gammaproteobacteria bacterium]
TFAVREAAETALDEALRRDAGNPWYLAEMGVLRLKQHMTNDAGRILKYALKRADLLDVQDPELRADIHFHLGYNNEVIADARPTHAPLPLRGAPDET